MKIFAIILITIGIGMLVFRSYTFNQENNRPYKNSNTTSKKMEERVIWPQYAGAFAMAIGVFILLGRNKLREE